MNLLNPGQERHHKMKLLHQPTQRCTTMNTDRQDDTTFICPCVGDLLGISSKLFPMCLSFFLSSSVLPTQVLAAMRKGSRVNKGRQCTWRLGLRVITASHQPGTYRLREDCVFTWQRTCRPGSRENHCQFCNLPQLNKHTDKEKSCQLSRWHL